MTGLGCLLHLTTPWFGLRTADHRLPINLQSPFVTNDVASWPMEL
jgi:hypothetical protein